MISLMITARITFFVFIYLFTIHLHRNWNVFLSHRSDCC